MGCCVEHEAVFDAAADVEAWEYALSVLRPLVEATKLIGSDELTVVMEDASYLRLPAT